MNTAIVLAGGSGSRMKKLDVPKQYLMVAGKPVISYCLETFEQTQEIDRIIIVADENYYEFLDEWIEKLQVSKFVKYAKPGKSRQHSIYEGLLVAKEFADEDEIVIIHDAARPMVSKELIQNCIFATKSSDGAMPVITVKDTIYMSKDGKHIHGLLNRDELFAGQAPESFRFTKYMQIHEKMSNEEIGQIRGSSEIAYKYGMNIELVSGSEDNFKITTMEDLDKFELLIHETERMS